MENPYASANRHPSELYYNLGQAMKNYVIAILVSCGLGIVGIVITLFMSPFITSEIHELSSSTGIQIIPLAAITGLFNFVWIGLLIYILVSYLQFLSSLKEIGSQLGDTNLQKTYKMEIGAIISCVIIGVLVLTSFIPLSQSFSYDSASFNASGFVSMFLLIFLGGFVVYIFQIMSAVYLDRWGQYLRYAEPNITTNSIAEGIAFMKWGHILNPFISGIGEIFYLVGMWKTGQNLRKYSSINNSRDANQYVAYELNPSVHGRISDPNARIYRPLQTHTTPTPQQHYFCSNCGSKITPPESKFCQNCGNKLV